MNRTCDRKLENYTISDKCQKDLILGWFLLLLSGREKETTILYTVILSV